MSEMAKNMKKYSALTPNKDKMGKKYDVSSDPNNSALIKTIDTKATSNKPIP